MKSYYWVTVFVMCITAPLYGADQEIKSLFSSANKSYISGDYEKAISLYHQINEKRGDSAELLYNMGNTYYKKGEIGMAVLYLERAFWLEPGNADIEKNLNAVRNNTGLMLEEESLLNRYMGYFTLNQWSVASAALLLALGLLVCIRAVSPRLIQNHTFRHIIIGLVVLGVLSLYGVAFQYLELERAIVVSSAAEVLISPFDGADQTASLKTGRTVYVLNEHDDYFSVKESSGTTGWVKKGHISKVIP